MLDVTTITIDEDSPRVGDQVRMSSDVLAEIARQAPGLPPTWRYLPAGTTGKLLGWRGEARAVVDIDDTAKRLVVFVSATNLLGHRPLERPATGRL